MVRRKQIILVLLLVPFFIFMVSDEEHSSGFKDFLGKTINFFVLIGALIYFLSKPLRSLLEKRATEIEHSMKEAEDSRSEAEERLRVVRERLSGLEEEAAQIKREAEIEGQKEKERIQELARSEAERLKLFARQEIEVYTNASIKELREHTAELATKLAQERIRKKLTPENQSLLLDKSIERFEKLYEKSDSG
ncbi:MAG: F0F1 ATP synthase subunit B [Candidatus Aminicenantes bacterium]|nr:MAG: F0F1 ATP synthase subunit B [Candidatus Aminicenantes bacterium]